MTIVYHEKTDETGEEIIFHVDVKRSTYSSYLKGMDMFHSFENKPSIVDDWGNKKYHFYGVELEKEDIENIIEFRKRNPKYYKRNVIKIKGLFSHPMRVPYVLGLIGVAKVKDYVVDEDYCSTSY